MGQKSVKSSVFSLLSRHYLIGILVAFLGAAILTYFVGFEDMEKKAESEESIKIEKGSIRITSPVEGEAIKLEDVKDEVFSSEAMGKGFAVMPTTGEVLAPEDCTVSVIFPTKHAIGLTLDSGIELLIHIGMNTVDLNGKFFVAACSGWNACYKRNKDSFI